MKHFDSLLESIVSKQLDYIYQPWLKDWIKSNDPKRYEKEYGDKNIYHDKNKNVKKKQLKFDLFD